MGRPPIPIARKHTNVIEVSVRIMISGVGGDLLGFIVNVNSSTAARRFWLCDGYAQRDRSMKGERRPHGDERTGTGDADATTCGTERGSVKTEPFLGEC